MWSRFPEGFWNVHLQPRVCFWSQYYTTPIFLIFCHQIIAFGKPFNEITHCALFCSPCVFIAAWADGPLTCFQFAAVLKQAALHVHGQNTMQRCDCSALRRWFLESVIRLPWIFTYNLLRSSQIYVRWLPVFCIGMRNVWMLQFLCIAIFNH